MQEYRKTFRDNAILEFGIENKAVGLPWYIFSLYAVVAITIQLFSSLGFSKPHILLYLVAGIATVHVCKAICTSVKKEALLVIAPLGLQHTVSYRCNGNETVTFVPWNDVVDVVINEAITLHRVIFYLAVLIAADDDTVKVVPLFQQTKPRLIQMIPVYQAIQKVLLSHRGPGVNATNRQEESSSTRAFT